MQQTALALLDNTVAGDHYAHRNLVAFLSPAVDHVLYYTMFCIIQWVCSAAAAKLLLKSVTRRQND